MSIFEVNQQDGVMVWFERATGEGYYSIEIQGASRADIDASFRDDPFYVGMEDVNRIPPPVVREWLDYEGDVPRRAKDNPPASINLEVERELPESLESPFWSQAEAEEQDDRENDALYHSRSEMPAYQSNDLDWELARSEWGWKHGDRDGEPEDYGLSEDDLDYDWDQFVGGDEPNPEWHKMEWPNHDNDDYTAWDLEINGGHTCVRCGRSTSQSGLPHCPHCGYDGTGQYVTLPQPEHDNDDRREAYYQAGVYPPRPLY